MVKFSISFFAVVLAVSLAFGPPSAWAQSAQSPAFVAQAATETLYVGLNKVEMLGLKKSAGTIIISDPAVLDVRLESSKRLLLLGLTVGETGFVVMDGRGRQIISVNVVVGPASEHNVSIVRDCTGASQGCAVEEEYSCSPRCIRVANPAEVVSTNATNTNTTTAAPAAGTTTPATTAAP